MSSSDLTLWGAGTVRQLRAHWMLMEMALEYEFVPVYPRSAEIAAAEFLQRNPRRKVPVLRHGALLFTESAAIVQYLSEAFKAPDGVYVPSDAAGRARVNEWCFFAMTELDAHSLYVIRKHVDLKAIYGDAPAAVQASRAYFMDQIGAMAPRIGLDTPFLLGDRLSAADIVLTSCLDWAVSIDIQLPESVAAYHARLLERPAYKAARQRTFAPRS